MIESWYDKSVALLSLQSPPAGGYPDLSPKSAAVSAVGGVTVSTAQYLRHGSSAQFDGAGHILIGDSTTLDFGTGAFTVLLLIRPTSAPGNNVLLASSHATWSTGAVVFRFNAGKLICYNYVQQSALIASASSIPLNAWTAVELSGSGSVTRLFINGILDATGAQAAAVNFGGNGGARLGSAAFDPGFIGQMQEFAAIKGIALHTANYAPEQICGTISNAAAAPVRDAVGNAAIRTVQAIPRATATSKRIFIGASGADGRYRLEVPMLEHNVLFLDDDPAPVYADKLASRVIPS